jgi:hypothetical protein
VETMTEHNAIAQFVQEYDDHHASDEWKTTTGIDLGIPENLMQSMQDAARIYAKIGR